MLRGSLSREGAVIGYVVTNNRFTADSRKSAEQDYPEIRLIDGERFIHHLLDYEIGIFTRGGAIGATDNHPAIKQWQPTRQISRRIHLKVHGR